METFSALLAICARNSPITGEFPSQRPVTRSFDVFFDLRLNKRLSKQSWGFWSEVPSRSLWRHCKDASYQFIKGEITTHFPIASDFSEQKLEWMFTHSNQIRLCHIGLTLAPEALWFRYNYEYIDLTFKQSMKISFQSSYTNFTTAHMALLVNSVEIRLVELHTYIHIYSRRLPICMLIYCEWLT